MTNAIDSKSMSKSRIIRVPEQLVGEWISEIWHEGTPVRVAASDLHLANEAAQWGYGQREPELQERADQELEACCDCILGAYSGPAVTGDARLIDKRILVQRLRAARRPKPPTLAEQALDQYERIEDVLRHQNVLPARCIRAALERLAELEAQQ
jgi:hypothetical protein